MASRWKEWSAIWPGPFRAGGRSHITTLLLIIALVLSTTGVVLADDGEGGPPDTSPPRPGATKMPPGANPEAARKAYMTLLFQEINVRRDRAGTPRYDYMADAGSEAIDAYLSDLLPAMVSTNSCFHGSDRPDIARAGWDYLGDIGIPTSEVGGEVLACPDTSDTGFWTPPGIATGWWNSSHHFTTLYLDREVNVVACGADVPIQGGKAYETVACITLKGDK